MKKISTFLLLCFLTISLLAQTPTLSETSMETDTIAPLLEEVIEYDTVICFDPETYEEQIMVVRKGSHLSPKSAPATAAYSDAGTSSTKKKTKKGPQRKAGQLTAGEWRDLERWTYWNKLMKDADFARMQSYWKYFPTERFSILLNDQSERAIADLEVSLVDDKGAVIWKGRSDNAGKAELWGNFYGESKTGFQLKVVHEGQQFSFEIKNFEAGQNLFKLPINCNPRNQVDLAFVVDATGSMSDEINYLKAELQDVIVRAQEENEAIAIRTGSVFYRDVGDEYLTRVSSFTKEIKTTEVFISKQRSGGGGDFPEAVHSALEKAVDSLEWSDEALSRLLFLVLDAPPHYDETVLESMRRSIKKAAAKGIKIIPITGSGIDRETEFLMKFFAMGTNGTYIFLTNHSGIGNDHLEPTADSYNVEMLNDLMVRLILENSEYESCETLSKKVERKQHTAFAKSKKKVRGLDFEINFYPNPTSNRLFIQLDQSVDMLSIKNINGQEVKRFGAMARGRTGIDVSSLTAGAYILQFQIGTDLVAERLVIGRGE